MPTKKQESKYNLRYWYRALEDSYFAAAFLALISPSLGELALMIGTETDYLAWARCVFSLIPSDMLLSIFY